MLVVEPYEDLRAAMAAALRAVGLAVVCVPEGARALAAARTIVPDVVVVEIDFAPASGAALVRALKADPALRHTTAIALTRTSDPARRRQMREAGCDLVVDRPTSDDRLVDLVLARHAAAVDA